MEIIPKCYYARELIYFKHPETLPYDRKVLNIIDATWIFLYPEEKTISQVVTTNIESLNL